MASVSAIDDDTSDTAWEYMTTTGSSCGAAQFATTQTSYTEGSRISFTAESDAGKRVCFKTTDTAGNAAVYTLSNPVKTIDRTAPVLSATRIGTGNTRTYRVRATDVSSVTGRTKDNVVTGSCTTSTTTTGAGWSDYTPGEIVGTAHNTNGQVCHHHRCTRTQSEDTSVRFRIHPAGFHTWDLGRQRHLRTQQRRHPPLSLHQPGIIGIGTHHIHRRGDTVGGNFRNRENQCGQRFDEHPDGHGRQRYIHRQHRRCDSVPPLRTGIRCHLAHLIHTQRIADNRHQTQSPSSAAPSPPTGRNRVHPHGQKMLSTHGL